MKVLITLALLLTITLAPALDVFAAPDGVLPVIQSTSPTRTQAGKVMTIKGEGFGMLEGSVVLRKEMATIVSWTDTVVKVRIPHAVEPGNISLTLTDTNDQVVKKRVKILEGPHVEEVYPSRLNIIPGATEVRIHGNKFGNYGWITDKTIKERNVNGQIIMGGYVIEHAFWVSGFIQFTAPEALKYDGVIELTIDGIEMDEIPYTVMEKGRRTQKGFYPNDRRLGHQYYLEQIHAFEGWAVQSSAEGVTVAIIDDGVYLNHPDLREHMWKNTGEVAGNKKDDDGNGYVDDVYGWNFVEDTAEMTVLGTHGTLVAGIIGAETNNTIGIAGIASGATLIPIIACDEDCETENIIDAITYAVDSGADVINISLGSNGTDGYTNEFDAAIEYAYRNGVVVVASAGNGDLEARRSVNTRLYPVSPLCNDNEENMVLGVTAIDEQGDILPWANYGACVDVVAPGLGILSTSVAHLTDGDDYFRVQGTSFAAPIVTGTVALMIARNSSLQPNDIIEIVRTTSHNPNEYSIKSGGGILSLKDALLRAGGSMKQAIPQQPQNTASASKSTTSNSGDDVDLKILIELFIALGIIPEERAEKARSVLVLL